MPRRKIENRTIEVILLQADKHLGEKYEIIRVKPIYARNILLPKKIVVLANNNMKNRYAQKMESAKKQRKQKAKGLSDLINKLEHSNGLTITRKTNKEGTLYAKVNEEDIAKLVKDVYKIDVDAHLFKTRGRITTIGAYNVGFMYRELKTTIKVLVQPENPDIIEEERKEEGKKSEEKSDKIEKRETSSKVGVSKGKKQLKDSSEKNTKKTNDTDETNVEEDLSNESKTNVKK